MNSKTESAAKLLEAATGGDMEALRALVASGSTRPAQQVLNQALLSQAWADQQVEDIRLLVAAGADIEARDDSDYMTPLIVAANKGAERNVRALIELGANVNAAPAKGFVYKGDTALHLACSRGYTGVADALIEAGANVNARGTEGETPLMVAARTNNERIAARLLRAGADPEARRDDQYTALGLAKGNSTAGIILKALAGPVKTTE